MGLASIRLPARKRMLGKPTKTATKRKDTAKESDNHCWAGYEPVPGKRSLGPWEVARKREAELSLHAAMGAAAE